MNKEERLARSSDLLRTFLSVAESLNITHAADSLGKTQSAISVQIRKLEETLEVRLFDRQARGMVLTRDGEKLLPVARSVISELARIGSLFQHALSGRLNVGIPDDYTETVLEKVMVEFSLRHPMVEISARMGCTSQFADAIRSGTLDVAVVPESQGPGAMKIASEINVWAAARSFTCDLERPVPLAILDRRKCDWRVFGSRALDSVGRKWRVVYASESFAGVKAAIRSGLAVGVLPISLMETSMKQLKETDGYPRLPETERYIMVSKKAPTDIADAMVDAIQAATSELRPQS